MSNTGRCEALKGTIARCTLRVVVLAALLLAAVLSASARTPEVRLDSGGVQRTPETGEQQFQKLVAQIAGQRLNGAPEDKALQEQALAILDRIICQTLTYATKLDLGVLNDRLARLVTQDPPLGESYRVVQLGLGHAYALVANFSLSGPAAVRVYSNREVGREGGQIRYSVQFETMGRIDRYSIPDFFDENVELLPLLSVASIRATATPDAVFVTVSGRSDELKTGAFAAWRFHQGLLALLWSSDLFSNSSYESAEGTLRVTYCAEADLERPRVCRRMVRETYGLRGDAWQRLGSADVPLAKPR